VTLKFRNPTADLSGRIVTATVHSGYIGGSVWLYWQFSLVILAVQSGYMAVQSGYMVVQSGYRLQPK
jgi:hypothetical protein